MNINKVLVYGRLVKDPELKSLNSGTKVCKFTVATNYTYKTNGEKREETEFHNIEAWAKLGELIAQYSKKGDTIYIEGRIKTDSWEKDGAKKYFTKIVAENMQFGDGNKRGERSETEQPEPEDDVPTVTVDDEEVTEEDIPF